MSRRALSIVFAVIVALQFSWTAVSMYCAHETGRAAQHFGHHQHVEDGDEVSLTVKGKQTAPAKFAAHAHCATCHHATAAIDNFEPPAHMSWATSAPNVAVAVPSSTFSTPPDRPQWHTAV